MRNNTIVPAALLLVILHACSGCGTTLRITRDAGKIDVELKTAAQVADQKGTAAKTATLSN